MRLCDAGETEGDVTHFVLAVPALIWTVPGRVGRSHSLHKNGTIREFSPVLEQILPRRTGLSVVGDRCSPAKGAT